MYTAFIDFAKALESVRLPSLWKYLDETRLNKKYINLWKIKISENATANIMTNISTCRQSQWWKTS